MQIFDQIRRLVRQSFTDGEETAEQDGWKVHCWAILDQIRLVCLLVKDPGVPWYAKVVAACTVGYVFSPVQLIPNFIPVIGQMDDVFVLSFGIKFLQRITPPEVLAACRSRVAREPLRQGARSTAQVAGGLGA